MPDLSLGDVGPAGRLGRHREVDTVAGQLGEDVRLEPVDEPTAQLDPGARQPASEGPAAQPVPGLKESASSADPHAEGCWQNLSGQHMMLSASGGGEILRTLIMDVGPLTRSCRSRRSPVRGGKRPDQALSAALKRLSFVPSVVAGVFRESLVQRNGRQIIPCQTAIVRLTVNGGSFPIGKGDNACRSRWGET